MDLRKLLSQMTLEDKLMQMTQLLGDYYISEDYGTFMGLSYGFEVDEYMAWNTGSILGIDGAKNLRQVQEEYLRRSKHKIPLLFMQDVIHGYRTIFPSTLGLACSWQPDLLEQMAQVSAKEASAAGIHVTFSPMADLSRDARWGRVVESTGEDVYLNSLYAAAMVRGYQGKNPAEPFRIVSCVKHFAGYGMAEAGRDYNTTEISERTLREQHFPAYKAALDAGAKMVMTSFNALNGVPASGNDWLYRDVLRGEWGFSGTVISDCTTVIELIYHGFAEDEGEAAQKAIGAGVDIEMVSTTYYRNAKALIDAKKLEPALIDRAVLQILELKEQLGLFENPYKDADEEVEKQVTLCTEHRALARRAAQQSAVLLKNDGVLPIEDKEKRAALIGPYASSREMMDIWCGKGKSEECISLAEGLSGRLQFQSELGCGFFDLDPQEEARAMALARESDLVVLALGEEHSMSAEAGSRAYLSLPGEQAAFVERIMALGKPTVLVLFAGRPLELGRLSEQANAILYAWYPGTEGGNALADLLLGEAEPSGRLTMSFPHTVGQCPLYYNHLPTGRPKGAEDTKERFCSRYLDAPNGPVYPFGYGLTYTCFAYEDAGLSDDTLRSGCSLQASVKLRNTGNRPGTETVQLYLRDLAGSTARPVRELKDFRRVTLQPGESCSVSFEINEELLKFYTLHHGYACEPGKFQVFIAADAEQGEPLEFIYLQEESIS